jgi:hypothetical protein
LNAFFFWLEATALSTWVRESTSAFAFPAILSAHAIGMGLAAGVNAAIAIRLLGFAPRVPPRELHRFARVMWIGVWLNTASGLLLLIGYPTKALTNPVFYLKLSLIAVGMWLYVLMTRQILSDDGGAGSDSRPGDRRPGLSGRASMASAPAARFLGAASLACWAGAVTTGRLLAYTAHRILASW